MVNPCTKVPATSASQLVEYNRPMPKARSGRDGRQEGRECSYYDLHCNLNNTLFHFLSLSVSSALPLTGVWH